MREVLEQHLSRFDGRNTNIVLAVHAELEDHPEYPDALLDLCHARPPLPSAASWLLNHHLKAGGSLSTEQGDRLLSSLTDLSRWDHALHVCQALVRLSVSVEAANAVSDLLVSLTKHDRPFLRAWALMALVTLAKTHKYLHDMAKAALDAAGDDATASVRARVRKLSM